MNFFTHFNKLIFHHRQVSPPPADTSIINADMFVDAFLHLAANSVRANATELSRLVRDEYDGLMRKVEALPYPNRQRGEDEMVHEMFYILSPVYSTLQGGSVVGWTVATLVVYHTFEDLVPDDVRGIDVVIDDCRGGTATIRIQGKKAVMMGPGDHHDSSFDDLRQTQNLEKHLWELEGVEHNHCG